MFENFNSLSKMDVQFHVRARTRVSQQAFKEAYLESSPIIPLFLTLLCSRYVPTDYSWNSALMPPLLFTVHCGTAAFQQPPFAKILLLSHPSPHASVNS